MSALNKSEASRSIEGLCTGPTTTLAPSIPHRPFATKGTGTGTKHRQLEQRGDETKHHFSPESLADDSDEEEREEDQSGDDSCSGAEEEDRGDVIMPLRPLQPSNSTMGQPNASQPLGLSFVGKKQNRRSSFDGSAKMKSSPARLASGADWTQAWVGGSLGGLSESGSAVPEDKENAAPRGRSCVGSGGGGLRPSPGRARPASSSRKLSPSRRGGTPSSSPATSPTPPEKGSSARKRRVQGRATVIAVPSVLEGAIDSASALETATIDSASEEGGGVSRSRGSRRGNGAASRLSPRSGSGLGETTDATTGWPATGAPGLLSNRPRPPPLVIAGRAASVASTSFSLSTMGFSAAPTTATSGTSGTSGSSGSHSALVGMRLLATNAVGADGAAISPTAVSDLVSPLESDAGGTTSAFSFGLSRSEGSGSTASARNGRAGEAARTSPLGSTAPLSMGAAGKDFGPADAVESQLSPMGDQGAAPLREEVSSIPADAALAAAQAGPPSAENDSDRAKPTSSDEARRAESSKNQGDASHRRSTSLVPLVPPPSPPPAPEDSGPPVLKTPTFAAVHRKGRHHKGHIIVPEVVVTMPRDECDAVSPLPFSTGSGKRRGRAAANKTTEQETGEKSFSNTSSPREKLEEKLAVPSFAAKDAKVSTRSVERKPNSAAPPAAITRGRGRRGRRAGMTTGHASAFDDCGGVLGMLSTLKISNAVAAASTRPLHDHDESALSSPSSSGARSGSTSSSDEDEDDDSDEDEGESSEGSSRTAEARSPSGPNSDEERDNDSDGSGSGSGSSSSNPIGSAISSAISGSGSSSTELSVRIPRRLPVRLLGDDSLVSSADGDDDVDADAAVLENEMDDEDGSYDPNEDDAEDGDKVERCGDGATGDDDSEPSRDGGSSNNDTASGDSSGEVEDDDDDVLYFDMTIQEERVEEHRAIRKKLAASTKTKTKKSTTTMMDDGVDQVKDATTTKADDDARSAASSIQQKTPQPLSAVQSAVQSSPHSTTIWHTPRPRGAADDRHTAATSPQDKSSSSSSPSSGTSSDLSTPYKLLRTSPINGPIGTLDGSPGGNASVMPMDDEYTEESTLRSSDETITEADEEDDSVVVNDALATINDSMCDVIEEEGDVLAECTYVEEGDDEEFDDDDDEEVIAVEVVDDDDDDGAECEGPASAVEVADADVEMVYDDDDEGSAASDEAEGISLCSASSVSMESGASPAPVGMAHGVEEQPVALEAAAATSTAIKASPVNKTLESGISASDTGPPRDSNTAREDRSSAAGDTLEAKITPAKEHAANSRPTAAPPAKRTLKRQSSTVRRGKWTLGSQIGAGSFGVVHVGMNTITGTLMAVKSIHVHGHSGHGSNSHSASGGGGSGGGGAASVSTNSLTNDLRREVDLMRNLTHPNIVRYIGSEIDHARSTLHIFQEWVPGGSVSSMLRSYGPFALLVVKSYLRQILGGLSYLHERGVLHRDIKGGNILVNDEGVVKLADFGASRRMRSFEGGNGVVNSGCLSPGGQSTSSSANEQHGEDMMESLTMRGTPYFMAPEVFEERYGPKADVWSVGGVAYQMVTGEAPWRGSGFSNPMSLFLYLRSHDDPPPLNLPASAAGGGDEEQLEALRSLVGRCFRRDPSKRPSARALLEDPFFDVDEEDEHSGSFSASPGALAASSPRGQQRQEHLRPPCYDSVVRSLDGDKGAGTETAPNGRDKLEVIDTIASDASALHPEVNSEDWPTWARDARNKAASPDAESAGPLDASAPPIKESPRQEARKASPAYAVEVKYVPRSNIPRAPSTSTSNGKNPFGA